MFLCCLFMLFWLHCCSMLGRQTCTPKWSNRINTFMCFKHVFLMHVGAMLVPKCSKMESPTSPLFGHFGILAPQWGLRGPLGTMLVAILVPAPPFGCRFLTCWSQRLLWGAMLVIFLTLCDHFLILSVTFVKSFRDVFTSLRSLCVLRYFHSLI